MDRTELLFALIRSEICKEALSESARNEVTPEVLPFLYKASKIHDLAHIVSKALDRHGLLRDGELAEKFRKEEMLAVYRHERIDHEYKSICKALGDAEIDYIPLKGAVIKEYYPESWYRTSADIDVLVKEDALNKAVEVLENKLGYTVQAKEYHDVSMFSKNGVHLELHFSIKEKMESIDKLLYKAWDFATPYSDYEYRFTNEFMIFHIVSHMSYHFITGGCGIRTFIDLMLLKKHTAYDTNALAKLLSECGLTKFYDRISVLNEVWFEDGEHTQITKALEEYIVSGGVFGSKKNKAVTAQNLSGGKARHIAKRIILPYDDLKRIYPILEKHRYLTPFAQAYRWCSIISKGKLKRSVKELKTNAAVTNDEYTSNKELLRELGLI